MNLRATTPPCLFRTTSCFTLLVALALTTPALATPLVKLQTPHFTSSIILIDDTKPPLPVPADAEDLSYDASSGSLEFTTKTKVKELAATYRDAMKALGWEEEPTVIDKDTMAALTFSKGEGIASITLMSMGDHTQVSADGLTTDTGSGSDGNSSSASASSSSSSDSTDAKQPLVAEDHNGLPVPTERSMMGDESSIFRHSVDVTTHATVKDFVEFYRTELGKKNWTEKQDAASVKDDSASLVFDTPNGPLTVQITQQGDDATAVLSTRDKDAASKSPLFPKPGQVKIGLGNINTKAADVVVNGKHVKVPGGAGAKAPDGPTLDVPPGQIKIELKGTDPQTIDAGPDQIWLVMVGPGGLLPVQAY